MGIMTRMHFFLFFFCLNNVKIKSLVIGKNILDKFIQQVENINVRKLLFVDTLFFQFK